MRRLAILLLLLSGVLAAGCEMEEPQAASGVRKATVQVKTDPDGYTMEQKNIANRLLMDNKPGSLKHLYILSPFTGDILVYATVKGKVTSGGKRLTPKTVTGMWQNGAEAYSGAPFQANGKTYFTTEMIQDDGTFGDSVEYLYFWTPDGRYYQISTEGVTWIISDQPIATRKAMIRLGGQGA